MPWLKRCAKCRQEKVLTEFHRAFHRYRPRCKACRKLDQVQYRRQHADTLAAMDRARRVQRREYLNAATDRWKERNPERALAHQLIRYAIRRGEIRKQPCEV